METHEEVIAAFLDDERVDVDALKRALSQPEGREYLVDVLALRELVGVQAGAVDTRSVAPPRAAVSRRMLLTAAAVLLSASTVAGYLVGHRLGQQAPDLLVHPGPEQNRSATEAAQVSAPAPTKVIRLQPGIDWNERSGGN